MTAVLMLTNATAVNVPGYVLMLGVVLAAAIGAVLQWATSAKQGQRITAVVCGVSIVSLMIAMIWDCGSWGWGCYWFI